MSKLWRLFFSNEGQSQNISVMLLTITLTLLPEHKVIIVGLDNAGKTTILYQL